MILVISVLPALAAVFASSFNNEVDCSKQFTETVVVRDNKNDDFRIEEKNYIPAACQESVPFVKKEKVKSFKSKLHRL